MSLTDDLRTPPPKSPRRECGIDKILKRIEDPKDRAALEHALDRVDEYPHSYLSGILARNNMPISPQVIARHRQGKCPCKRQNDA